MKKYKIKSGYTHREEPLYFDDSHNSDEWQYEVYQFSYTIAKILKKRPVLDIGCGSGYKLINIFHDFDTIGIDIEETYNILIKKFPNNKWRNIKKNPKFRNKFGVVILADVIEHIINPNEILEYIKNINFEYLIISTPNRSDESLSQDGPPINIAHAREWTIEEFNKYISEHFEIINHFIINKQQRTQCIICKKKQDIKK